MDVIMGILFASLLSSLVLIALTATVMVTVLILYGITALTSNLLYKFTSGSRDSDRDTTI